MLNIEKINAISDQEAIRLTACPYCKAEIGTGCQLGTLINYGKTQSHKTRKMRAWDIREEQIKEVI